MRDSQERPSPEASHSRRKRKALCLVGILTAMVAGAIAVAVILLSKRNGKSAANNDSLHETTASIAMLLHPADSLMVTEEEVHFVNICAHFFQQELIGVIGARVELTSQDLVQVPSVVDERALRASINLKAQVPLGSLEITSMDLVQIVNVKYSSLLQRLQEGNVGGYFEGIEMITASEISPSTPADSPSVAPDTNRSGCNGLDNLCMMPINEVLFATMHNANADASVVNLQPPNHNRTMLDGLRSGIRGINVDIGKCSRGEGSPAQLALVHGRCVFGFSDPKQKFREIHAFLSNNPNEVLLMPTEINDNAGGGAVRLDELYSLMQEVVDSSGKSMADRLYDGGRPWPTLGEMIRQDKRILFMVYNGQETCVDVSCPPGFYDWFTYAAETPFSFNSVSDILNTTASCQVTRGRGGFKDFFGINVFLRIPDGRASQEINQAEFLQRQLETCSSITSLSPSVIAVDFWSVGDVLKVVRDHNELLRPPQVSHSPTSMPARNPISSPPQPTLSSRYPYPTYEPSTMGHSLALTVQPTILDAPIPDSNVPSQDQSINPTFFPIPTSLPTYLPPSEIPTFFDDLPSSAFPTSPPEALEVTPEPLALRRCNGLHNLCDVRVNDILFATMHNANSNPNHVFLAPNHRRDILTALRSGIRGLNLDIGKCNINGQPSLALVHALCLLGFADPVEVFREINQFLMDNPDEVILMPCQINNDTGGTVRLGEIYAAMQQAFDSGGTAMSDRLYAHPGVNSPWPTLAQLIDLDKRILFFHYNGENCAALGGDCPRGFHDWFTYAAETRFAFPSVADLTENPEAACTITRGGGGTRDFFGINVFTQIPSLEASRRLNSRNFLADHIRTCAAQNGLTPNAILIDFWEEGDVLAVVEEHNAAFPS